MKINKKTLKNKLDVLMVDFPSFDSIVALLLVKTGSRYEQKANNGVAHFFEHMAFKGTQSYQTAMKLSSEIEGFGGEFNAFTSKEYTGYWIKGTSNKIGKIVEIIADMTQRPLLQTKEIEKERGVIIEEMNMYEDMPAHKVAQVFDELMYKGSSLGYDTLGTKQSVSQMNRSDFLDYLHRYYVPNNSTLIISGRLGDQNRILDDVEKYFGAWEKTEKIDVFAPFTQVQQKPQMAIYTKKTEQAHIIIGHRAFSYHDKKKHALSLLSMILGGGMSSRLFQEIREHRGLCYYVSTERALYDDVGEIYTRAGVVNNVDKVSETIQAILKEYEKVKNGEVKEEELKRAKELLKGRLILSLEDSFNVAYFFGKKYLLEGKLILLNELIKEIDKVTVAQVIEVARDLLVDQGRNIAVIGPFEKTDFKDFA